MGRWRTRSGENGETHKGKKQKKKKVNGKHKIGIEIDGEGGLFWFSCLRSGTAGKH